jgi:hypothetical protein
VARLSDAGIHAVSGMMATEGEDYSTLDTIRVTGGIRPDETWRQNLAAAQQERNWPPVWASIWSPSTPGSSPTIQMITSGSS